MKTGIRALTLVLLLALCVASGYGWGNLTHVYIAKHLGVKFGPVNMNEMYGAVLPDMFNLAFEVPGYEDLAGAFHVNEALLGYMYSNAPSRNSKAAAWGIYTHNNVWGADKTAHGEYPGDESGWVIQQGALLAPAIGGDLLALNGGFAALGEDFQRLTVAMGHDIVETAVDILVRRELDPLAGARLYVAAQYRSGEIPTLLAGALTMQGVPEALTTMVEGQYREGMMQYGQMFMLPESQLIQTIAAVSAGIAHDYILAVTDGAISVEIPPALVQKYVETAIKQVRKIYKRELCATTAFVQENLVAHGITPAAPILAFSGNGSIEEELDMEASNPIESVPTEYRLEQNYPNPFNPSTAIRFAVPADGNVSLKVSNAIGQEVATLIDAYTPAGRHEIHWEANNLPSGVYLYRLVAGTVVETKKMTLMK